MKLKIKSVRYHRNGVAGIGFFAVDFVFETRRLLATVWTDEDHKTTEHYAVISPDSMLDRWRGDTFTDDLLAAIRVAVDNGSAFNQEPFATVIVAPTSS